MSFELYYSKPKVVVSTTGATLNLRNVVLMDGGNEPTYAEVFAEVDRICKNKPKFRKRLRKHVLGIKKIDGYNKGRMLGSPDAERLMYTEVHRKASRRERISGQQDQMPELSEVPNIRIELDDLKFRISEVDLYYFIHYILTNTDLWYTDEDPRLKWLYKVWGVDLR